MFRILYMKICLLKRNQAIVLFNVEHEHLGIVRNLVGVGLGSAWRAGIQPAASDALGFLVAVNDRVVFLIEELDRREQEQRQLQTEAEQRGLLSATQESPGRARGKGKKKRSPFFKPISGRFSGGNRSPGYRSKSKSPTRPSTSSGPPPEELSGSPQQLAERTKIPFDGHARRGTNKSLRPPRPTLDADVRLQHLLEGARPEDNGEAGTAAAAAADENNPATDGNNLEVGGGRAPGGPGRRVGRATSSSSSPPPASCLQGGTPRDFLSSAPVLLHSYTKLLNSLVCGSYNLRAAFSSSCEADLRNIRRRGGYLDVLAGLDDGAPRKVFREAARFLHEIMIECDCR